MAVFPASSSDYNFGLLLALVYLTVLFLADTFSLYRPRAGGAVQNTLVAVQRAVPGTPAVLWHGETGNESPPFLPRSVVARARADVRRPICQGGHTQNMQMCTGLPLRASMRAHKYIFHTQTRNQSYKITKPQNHKLTNTTSHKHTNVNTQTRKLT